MNGRLFHTNLPSLVLFKFLYYLCVPLTDCMGSMHQTVLFVRGIGIYHKHDVCMSTTTYLDSI